MGLAHSPQIITNGLVLALDAGNAKSYPGSGTEFVNLVDNTNNSSLVSSPSYSSGYFQLDGSTQYVNCGNSTLFDTSVFTVSFWFNPTVITTKEIVIKNRNTNDGPGPFEIFINGSGKIVHRLNGGSDVTSNGTIIVNNWKMITLTYDLTKRILYFNDTLDIESAYSTSITYSTGNLTWGAYGNGLYAINAKISSLMYYNRALTAAEIKQNFNALRGRYGI